ncbi:hypothetical protein TNCV_808081 [Trichonephila clavipes]|nr:hypothetical protein TNCV_808081 [Trichonephila clavipes]
MRTIYISATYLVIFIFGQITKTIFELAPNSLSLHTKGWTLKLNRFNVHQFHNIAVLQSHYDSNSSYAGHKSVTMTTRETNCFKSARARTLQPQMTSKLPYKREGTDNRQLEKLQETCNRHLYNRCFA